ncbi:hypothetical protein [Pandoravirus japonicus]|uniref:Uncharacterized protein n=1 Tax=Pandoravirus japonicus TaxID=2823154 RepID=A0A811BQN1_9VIRU|nr:hypothetical protein [Pandoravirus japonicus]
MASKSLLSLCRSRLILLSGCARHEKGKGRKPHRHQNQNTRFTGVFLIKKKGKKRSKIPVRVGVWFAQKRGLRSRPRT